MAFSATPLPLARPVPGARPIAIIIGTRPEAIKLAPLVLSLRRCGWPVTVLASGQQAALAAAALADFGLAADTSLDLAAPSPDALLGMLVPALAAALKALQPGWVVVQGDTTTALAGALAARYAQVPLAHVEAGLRTGRDDPFPEEMHRRTIASLAQLHFAPTAAAAAALRAEGIADAAITTTGNTGVDALLVMRDRLAHDHQLQARAARPLAGVGRARPWVLATIHRRENHGRRLDGVLAAISALAADVQVLLPVHTHPAVAGPVQARLGGHPGVTLLQPLGYASFVWLMGQCRLVLTDSGGVQEEAPALGLPCLVLRQSTERPEGLASGHARLVGTERARIIAATRAALARPALAPALPYGNGRAAAAISSALTRPIGAAWAQSPENWWQSAGHRQPSRAAAH